jgi:hypothetical protein
MITLCSSDLLARKIAGRLGHVRVADSTVFLAARPPFFIFSCPDKKTVHGAAYLVGIVLI